MAGWRDRFSDPIDFAALAVERSKKGWRPTPAQKAAWAKKRAAAKRKAVRGAAERLKEARKLARATKHGKPTGGAGAAFLAAFQPGCWYGVGDLQALSGLKRGTVHGLTAKFWKQGELERTKNPAFVRAGFQEPEWLYRRVLFSPSHAPKGNAKKNTRSTGHADTDEAVKPRAHGYAGHDGGDGEGSSHSFNVHGSPLFLE